MKLSEIATKLRRHPETIRSWVKAGILKPKREGIRGDFVFSKKDLTKAKRWILLRET
jgi:DNA-binding transcriptional MerR regulator